MKTAALYIRVSTDDQTEYSPDAQKRLLLEYAKNNNLAVSNEYIFIEEGLSGTKADKRPKFQKMIGLAKLEEHPFDVILVWKFSRFARNQEESILYKSLLKKINIDVISVSEPLIDGPFGSLMERIIEWMDEYYSIRLAGEVKRGMTEKALRGEFQASTPLGYDMEDGVLSINPETSPIIKDIFNMYLSGGNFFSIARSLNDMGLRTKRGNKFENRTVQYILQNPVYKGYVRWNPEGKTDLRQQKNHSDELIIRKSTHEPIIPEELWNQTNDKLLKEYRPRHRKPNTLMLHWLGGILTCSNCHSTLVSGGGAGGYQCSAYSKGRCNESHYVSYKKIEKSVIDALGCLANAESFDYEIIELESSNDHSEIIKESLRKLKIKSKRILDAYMNEVDTLEEYKENKSKIEAERISLESQLADLKTAKKTKKTDAIMLSRIKDLYSIILSDSDYITKNNALKGIIKKIVYDKKTEHIDVFLYYS